MTSNKEVVALRCHAILCRIDFLVCAVNAHTQYFHQYTSPIWNVRHFWHRYLFQMHRIRFTWIDSYCFHLMSSFSSFYHQFLIPDGHEQLDRPDMLSILFTCYICVISTVLKYIVSLQETQPTLPAPESHLLLSIIWIVTNVRVTGLQ